MSTRHARESKGLRATWKEESMSLALAALKKNTMSVNQAAKNFKVPKATLLRRLGNKNKYANGSKILLGRPSDLPVAVENELAEHCIKLESMFYGLSQKNLRKLAYQIASTNNIATRFNSENEIAGKDWLYGFLKRHPELAIRMPEPTSLSRASGFNREQVTRFFDLLDEIMAINDIPPSRIFNMDESGISIVPNRISKVIGKKGKRQIGSITSTERGQNVTVICCMSASGHYVPPGIIFPRIRMKEELKNGAPPGSIFFCQKKGWIDMDIFAEWMDHFINNVKPNEASKVLLILDGLKSHTHNLKALEKAKKSGVIMLSLPPHTSHRTQPLDISFFKPLKTYYNQHIEQWMRANPGRALTMFQISELFGLAYGRAATVRNAISGFNATGIWPLNPLMFTDEDFSPSEVTDSPLPANGDVNNVEPQQAPDSISITTTASESVEYDKLGMENSVDERQKDFQDLSEAVSSEELLIEVCDVNDEAEVSCFSTRSSENNIPTENLEEIAQYVSVESISSIPKLTRPAGMKRRAASRSTVLTSSPHKRSVEEKVQKKNSVTSSARKPRARKIGSNRANKFRNYRQAVTQNINNHSSTNSTDYYCIVCGESNDEDWIRCCRCRKWAHEACADVTNEKYYYCDMCL